MTSSRTNLNASAKLRVVHLGRSTCHAISGRDVSQLGLSAVETFEERPQSASSREARSTRWITRVLPLSIPGGVVTKSAPFKALKLIAWRHVDF